MEDHGLALRRFCKECLQKRSSLHDVVPPFARQALLIGMALSDGSVSLLEPSSSSNRQNRAVAINSN